MAESRFWRLICAGRNDVSLEFLADDRPGSPRERVGEARRARGAHAMANQGNLWAVTFEGTTRAAEVQNAIIKLGSEKHDITLLDIAVAVRFSDGSLTLNGEAFPDAIRAPR